MKYLLIAVMLVSTAFAQVDNKIANAFINSVKLKKFSILQPYINTASNTTVKTKWAKVLARTTKNKINFNNLKIENSITGKLIEGMQAHMLLITYNYNNIVWDDITLLLNKSEIKIIDIPNDTQVFAMNADRNGRNLTEFNNKKIAENERQAVIAAVEMLQEKLMANDTLELSKLFVFRGDDDKANRWKRPLDITNSSEKEFASEWISDLKKIFKSDAITYGILRVEKESEGTWHAIEITCNNKKAMFAFLKIDGKFLLGDID